MKICHTFFIVILIIYSYNAGSNTVNATTANADSAESDHKTHFGFTKERVRRMTTEYFPCKMTCSLYNEGNSPRAKCGCGASNCPAFFCQPEFPKPRVNVYPEGLALQQLGAAQGDTDAHRDNMTQDSDATVDHATHFVDLLDDEDDAVNASKGSRRGVKQAVIHSNIPRPAARPVNESLSQKANRSMSVPEDLPYLANASPRWSIVKSSAGYPINALCPCKCKDLSSQPKCECIDSSTEHRCDFRTWSCIFGTRRSTNDDLKCYNQSFFRAPEPQSEALGLEAPEPKAHLGLVPATYSTQELKLPTPIEVAEEPKDTQVPILGQMEKPKNETREPDAESEDPPAEVITTETFPCKMTCSLYTEENSLRAKCGCGARNCPAFFCQPEFPKPRPSWLIGESSAGYPINALCPCKCKDLSSQPECECIGSSTEHRCDFRTWRCIFGTRRSANDDLKCYNQSFFRAPEPQSEALGSEAPEPKAHLGLVPATSSTQELKLPTPIEVAEEPKDTQVPILGQMEKPKNESQEPDAESEIGGAIEDSPSGAMKAEAGKNSDKSAATKSSFLGSAILICCFVCSLLRYVTDSAYSL